MNYFQNLKRFNKKLKLLRTTVNNTTGVGPYSSMVEH